MRRQWTTSGPGPRLGVLVHHEDAEREWAYDRDSHIGNLGCGLDEAPKRKRTIVSMKSDWKDVYPFGDRDTKIHLHGGYFYLSYFLTGEHIPWNRSLGTIGRVEPFDDFYGDGCFLSGHRGPGAWQIAVRLSYANFNDDDVFGGIGQSVTFGLNWHWNAHARLQLNYISGRVDDRLADLARGGSAMVSGSYQVTGARCIIDF